MHQRGIATLLLEHLVSLARAQQLRAFTAETLSENTPMLRVFSEAGLAPTRHPGGGGVMITIPRPPHPTRTALECIPHPGAPRSPAGRPGCRPAAAGAGCG